MKKTIAIALLGLVALAIATIFSYLAFSRKSKILVSYTSLPRNNTAGNTSPNAKVILDIVIDGEKIPPITIVAGGYGSETVLPIKRPGQKDAHISVKKRTATADELAIHKKDFPRFVAGVSGSLEILQITLIGETGKALSETVQKAVEFRL